MPVPSHSKRWNSQGRAACFTFHLIPSRNFLSSLHCFPHTPLGGGPMETAVKQQQDPCRHVQLQQCHPVMGRLPCGAVMRAPAARYRALREAKKREESQDFGSTSKTAAREAEREESLSPEEYKNQWGDEQGQNCKNSNRGEACRKENRGREWEDTKHRHARRRCYQQQYLLIPPL